MANCKDWLDISLIGCRTTDCAGTPKTCWWKHRGFRNNGKPSFHASGMLCRRTVAWNPCSHALNRNFLSRDSALRCKRPNNAYAKGVSSLERWERGAASTEAAETDAVSVDIQDTENILLKTAELDAPAAQTGSDVEEKGQPLKGIFPGGMRRTEVRLPGLIAMLRVSDVLGPGAKEFLDMLDSAIAGGFTMLVLDSGNDESSGGGRLYEAARLLKSLLRGRAELLVAERLDIAAAAGASGVLLSDEGLPAVVARSTMQNVSASSSVLPLVARSVRSAQSALSATASEGADFLILQVSADADAKIVVSNVCERVSIPVFVQASALNLSAFTLAESSVLLALQAGASGLVFSGDEMKNVAADRIAHLASSLVSAMSNLFQHRSASGAESLMPGTVVDETVNISTKDVATSQAMTLDVQAQKILEEERVLLTSLIELVQEATPEMEEVSLLVDAVAQLDEPVLLVIVGEFNSGKSSVINALLGKRYLNEGVLPTTNEITLLKHAGEVGDGKERSERHPDGHFIFYLSAELLKQMNLVDTPGTNVILKRQQRLTEEFVPRADLVLFVLSADRPLTESEMTFLQYIRQWGKKIIFLLNKSDIYSDVKELDEVVKFVKENAQQLLSVEQAAVYPISARQALKAKNDVVAEDGSPNVEKLLQSTTWKSSGFDKLENYIDDFLGGSSDAGAERKRLKLETPLGIAVALLEACEGQLSTQAEKAEADLDVLEGLVTQLDNTKKAMENDASLLRQRVSALIVAAKGRADNFVDSILRLSNVDGVARYLLGGDRQGKLPVSSNFDQQVMGSIRIDVQRLLEEHQSWLKDTIVRQVSSYTELTKNRWPGLKTTMQERTWSAVTGHVQLNSAIDKKDSIAVLDGFDTQAAKILLEEELRQVVLTTFGGLGAAGVSASVLTSVLPSTWEDLIALGVCSAGGLVGVWNLPSRRAEVKKKVQKVADSFARQMEAAMERELRETVERLEEDIGDVLKPYHEAARAEATRVSKLQHRIQETSSQLRSLRLQIQNLGIS